MRGLGIQVVDLSADFRLARPADLRELVRPARRARAAGGRRLRAHRARPRADQRRRAGRQPRLLPDRGAAGAGAARRARGDRVGRRSTPSRASRAPGATAASDCARQPGRELVPYGVDGHRHLPEIDQELRARSGPRRRYLRPPPAADRPGPARQLLRRARPSRLDEIARLYAERYADEPFVEVARSRPGVRDVRDTNLCRIHAPLDERRAVVLRGDRQPLEGRRRARRSRT